MKKREVNIDFKKMESAVRKYVVKKALESGTTIVYQENGHIVEEDPKSFKKTILKNLKQVKVH